MTKQEINVYGMKISQASRTELVVIMYDIAINYLDDAIKFHNAGDTDDYRKSVKNAKNFINELSSILDMKYKISSDLYRIYSFMNRALVHAEITEDVSEIDRIKGMLIRLKESFEKVSESDDSGPVMENAQQVYAGLTYSKSSLNEDVYNDGKRGFTV